MRHVRGPFIEYECSYCGTTVQETAPRNPFRLNSRIIEANLNPERRVCAACGTAKILADRDQGEGETSRHRVLR